MKCLKCGNEFPVRIIIEGKSRNLCKRKFCLECSPWKKHNTKNIINHFKDQKLCSRCKRTLNTNCFYRDKSREFGTFCKECTKNITRIRYQKIKEKIVQDMGGGCTKCGYNRHLGSLEFHHLDPNEKEHNDILKKSKAIRTEELKKCILLCSNCHKEEHFNINNTLVT